jgi:hypothetical protein
LYNGELNGSAMIVTTQSLSDPLTDEYPLLNNVMDNVTNPRYIDVNSITPYNFDLFMANSASKSASETDLAVPSYFPSQAYKIPRYDGSKSTSQKINEWTPGDVGTIGKTPTAESLKTSVAYCDSILSLSPEREDASKVHVKYLINADGTVSVPNSTPNSLQNNQGNFITGENVFISSRDEGINTTSSIGSNNNKAYKKIIRGASRIEPILYNQIGSKPPQWEDSIELQNFTTPAVGDYTKDAYIDYSTDNPSFPKNQPTVFYLRNDKNIKNLHYIIDSNSYTDMVKISLTASFWIENEDDNPEAQINAKFFYSTDGITFNQFPGDAGQNFFMPDEGLVQITIYRELDPLQLKNWNNWIISPGVQPQEWYYLKINNPPIHAVPELRVNQYPDPGSPPTISIPLTPPNIWESASFGYPAIYTRNTFLIDAYKINQTTPTWYMKNIPNSGYDPILTEWGVKRGDVFRFEGDEKKSFMVDYVTTESIPYMGSSIMVYLDKPIPSTLDINKFSLVRYVDDASQIIIEGFRPNNSSAPYILKPEFVVPELDKDIDAFIVDLTQKGLL